MADLISHRQLKVTCETIAKAAEGVSHWGWDAYLNAALAVFPATASTQVATLLAKVLPWGWDAKTVGQAPAPVAAQAQVLGGMRVGQRLFTSDTDHGALVFAAWWPWGDGKKISLRVGVICPGRPDTELAALKKELRAWFQI